MVWSRKRNLRKTGSVCAWIEANFDRRDCNRFIPSPDDNSRCCCGNRWQYHSDGSPAMLKKFGGAQIWNPLQFTVSRKTNAFGSLEFKSSSYPSRAQFIRVSYDTRPSLLLQLLLSAWRIEFPKLIVSVIGGRTSFELNAKIKKKLRRGLVRMWRTVGAWIITEGTYTGVSRHVGDAISGGAKTSRFCIGHKPICIGIAPWGIIQGRQQLIDAKGTNVPYHTAHFHSSRVVSLDNHHTHFLLADNGTIGHYGAEYVMRRALEKYISSQISAISHSSGRGVPFVCLVIEGGINTVRAVLEYLTDTPPVPVVVCNGTGRTADLLSTVHKSMKLDTVSGQWKFSNDELHSKLVAEIKQMFGVNEEKAQYIFLELCSCCSNHSLITIYEIEERILELDEAILNALLDGYHLCEIERLHLALSWNRVDVARKSILDGLFTDTNISNELCSVMMDALIYDRVDFVKFLLDKGIFMSSFLTISRLEELYNSKQGPSNTLCYLMADVKKGYIRGSKILLTEIGLIINHLMGGAYRCRYATRRFRQLYNIEISRRHTQRAFQKSHVTSTTEQSDIELNVFNRPFEYPFNELMVWAILTRRPSMARLMWQLGDEALAKSLIACKLYKALAYEAVDDKLEIEFYKNFSHLSHEYAALAVELVECMYQRDRDCTQQLLTCELSNWSCQTCLSLAVAADHKALLSLPCCQMLLADLWLGGMCLRRYPNFQVLSVLLCPILIPRLDFRSVEELKHMPTTEEQHHNSDQLVSDEECNPTDLNLDLVYENDLINIERVEFKSLNGSIKYAAQENTLVSDTWRHIRDSNTSRHELSLKTRIYEFYTAPITKFWAFTLGYLLFICFFTHLVLVRMSKSYPSWQEIYVTFYIVTLAIDKIREILVSEPFSLRKKLYNWLSRLWNLFDASFIIIYLLAQPFRYLENWHYFGRILICCNSCYWYLRILDIFSVERYLGPMVHMLGKMLQKMIHFIVLLLVILFAFGVFRQAIRHPNEHASWYLLRHVFYQPYFMLYGEVFAPEIEPAQCGDPSTGLEPCELWITIVAMTAYLLVANILMLNLLIAVFNHIFARTYALAHQVWMSERYRLVIEFEDKPILPPPFIFICHLYRLLVCRFRSSAYHNGLKLFLDKESLEFLQDFEEDSVSDFLRVKEYQQNINMNKMISPTYVRSSDMIDFSYFPANNTNVSMSPSILSNTHDSVGMEQNLAAASMTSCSEPSKYNSISANQIDYDTQHDTISLSNLVAINVKTPTTFSNDIMIDDLVHDDTPTVTGSADIHSFPLNCYSSSISSSPNHRPNSPDTRRTLISAEDSEYQMMESLIQRRLRRPSENLSLSLEDVNAVFVPIKGCPEETADAHDIKDHSINE